MIKDSHITHIDSDLEQYVYEVLLSMDNEKLQVMYDTGKNRNINSPSNQLRRFISQIIKNQRNNGGFYRSLSMKYNELQETIPYIEHEHNWKCEIMMNEIENVTCYTTGLTQLQMRNLMSVSLVHLYYLKEIPKWKLCLDYSIGVTTLNMLLKEGRDFLKIKIESVDENKFIDDIPKKKETINDFTDQMMELLTEINETTFNYTEYYKNNKDRILERRKFLRKYCDFTPEEKARTKGYQKKYYDSHHQKCLDIQHDYYHKHREEIIERTRQNQINNPDYKQYQREQYLKRKKTQDGNYINDDSIKPLGDTSG